MIKYLFTNNDLIGSKLISEFTRKSWQSRNRTASHTGVLFFGLIVVHSNATNGVHIEPFYSFKKKNKIVCALRRATDKRTRNQAEIIFEKYCKQAYGKSYDYAGVVYFTYRIILERVFKLPLPKVNKWENPDKWFCDELMEIELGRDISMTTPNELMLEMESSGKYLPCETTQ